MPTIAPDLARAYEVVTQPSAALRARVVAAVATVAHALLTEFSATATEAQRAWARMALARPLTDVTPALWLVAQSPAFRRAGDTLTDADLLALLVTHVDVLAAPTTGPA